MVQSGVILVGLSILVPVVRDFIDIRKPYISSNFTQLSLSRIGGWCFDAGWKFGCCCQHDWLGSISLARKEWK